MFKQIEVRGVDAVTFLQAQLTQDLDKVTPTLSPLGAWCDPKGRVIVLLRLLALQDGIGLVMPSQLAGTVLQELLRYRLRADLELVQSPADWQALAVDNASDFKQLQAQDLLPGPERNSSCRRDGVTAVRLDSNAAVVELYGTTAALEGAGLSLETTLSEERWKAARIAAGIADIGTHGSRRFTPHMLNLDSLAAVSFDKGCYSGQEIIARTQYRGRVGRRLRHLRAQRTPDVGDALRQDGQDVGEVVCASDGEVLALLPVGTPQAGLATAAGIPLVA